MSRRIRSDDRERIEIGLDSAEPLPGWPDPAKPLDIQPGEIIDREAYERAKAEGRIAELSVSRVSEGVVHLPTHTRKREPVEVGVGKVRRPAAGTGERKVRARTAGEDSELFRSGGEAFERWCVAEKGIDPKIKRPVAEYEALLAEFADRPIHGHRRGPKGGNHRPNRNDLR